MSHNNPTDLIFGHAPMQHQTKRHQHPRQVRRRKHQQPQEAQSRVRVAPRPNVDQRAAESGAKKGHREHGGEAEEDTSGVEKKPRELRGGAAGGFLEEAGVALEEEDVEEEVEGEGAEVEEGGEEAPVLWSDTPSACACYGPFRVSQCSERALEMPDASYLVFDEYGTETVE